MLAFRIVLESVVGVGIGCALGYGQGTYWQQVGFVVRFVFPFEGIDSVLTEPTLSGYITDTVPDDEALLRRVRRGHESEAGAGDVLALLLLHMRLRVRPARKIFHFFIYLYIYPSLCHTKT